MIPSVDSLAALLDGFDCAMLTVVDADARPSTRPMMPLKVPFNGHLWLQLGADRQPAAEIGRGAHVSVAYGSGAEGPYVTVYGWAILLRDPPDRCSTERVAGGSGPPQHSSPRLICVTARAVEIWDAASTTSRRVFAFSSARPVREDAGLRLQEPALAPRGVLRLVTSAASCAQ